MTKSPDAFKTISEVASDLDLPQHVLRFWETRFSQIKPMKRAGGRRYYRPEDVSLLTGIRQLLYGQGYTIKGVQKILKEQGNGFVVEIGNGGTPTLAAEPNEPGLREAVPVSRVTGASRVADGSDATLLRDALTELLECKRLLDQAR
ncbi:MAG: MerR family transcriptional regulator [Pseudomonadota bacterium]